MADLRDEDIVVPDDIMNFDFDQVNNDNNKASTAYRDIIAKSSFIITLNPNLGNRVLKNKAQLQVEYRKLYRINAEFTNQLNRGIFFKPTTKYKGKPEEWQPPPLDGYDSGIEIGGKKGQMHVQGLVKAGGNCFLDVAKIKDFMSKYYAHTVYVQVRFTQLNSEEALKAYVGKGSGINPNTAMNSNSNSNLNSQKPNLSQTQVPREETKTESKSEDKQDQPETQPQQDEQDKQAEPQQANQDKPVKPKPVRNRKKEVSNPYEASVFQLMRPATR